MTEPADADREPIPPGRRLFLLLFSLFLFLLPLKFGNPIVLESVAIWPSVGDAPFAEAKQGWFYPWLFSLWPNQLGLLLAFLLVLLALWTGPDFSAARGAAFFLPCLFLATQLAAMPLSVTPQVSLDTVVMFVAGIGFYAIGLTQFRSDAALQGPLLAVAAATLIIALVAMWQYFEGLEQTRQFFHLYFSAQEAHPDYLIKLGGNRAFATFVYPNTLAGYLVLVLPVLLAGVWRLREQWKPAAVWLLMGLTTVTVLFALVLSGSKGGFIALAATAVAAFYLVRMSGRIKVLLLAALLVCAAALVAHYGDRFGGYALSTGEARINYWRAGWRIFLEYPWLGSGPGTFGSVYPRFKLDTSEDPRLAHNNFLQALTDSGLPGFIAYSALWLWPLATALRRCRRGTDPLSTGLALSLTAWVVHGLLDFDQFIPSLALLAFFFLGLLQNRASQEVPDRRIRRPFAIAATLVVALICLFPVSRLKATYHAEEARRLARINPYAAQKELDRAIALAPLDAFYNFESARLAAQTGRSQEVMVRLLRARLLDPCRPLYAWEVAIYRRQMEGLTAGYFSAAEAAISLAPRNPRYRLTIANDYEAAGDPQRATSHRQANERMKGSHRGVESALTELPHSK